MQSTETKDLFKALVNVQTNLKGAIKDADNPFFKSKYADLESCWDACRSQLSLNGLAVIQTMEHEGGHDFLVTTLAHLSGQWIRGRLRLTPVKNDPQAMGSAITYARRYTLAAIVGITQTDDDGESAMDRTNKFPAKPVVRSKMPQAVIDALDYRIPFGQYKGKSLNEIELVSLRDYIAYIEDQAIKENKPITGTVRTFIVHASKYIADLENERPEEDVRY